MLRIEVKTDSSALMSRISYLVPELRVQTAKALNWTIYNVRDAQRRAMAQVFDRPTPFTLNQTNRVMLATPDLLQAQTKIRDDQSTGVAPSNYLGPQIYGGRRKVKANEKALQDNGLMPTGWIAIPGPGARLDAYGNMSRGQIVQILSALRAAEQVSGFSANITGRSAKRNTKARDYFVSTPTQTNPRGGNGRLPYGVYQRLPGGRIVTVMRFRNAHQYKPRFDYGGIAQTVAETDFPRLMRKAFAPAAAKRF